MVYFSKDIIFQVSIITDSWTSYVWMKDLCVCFCVYVCTYLHMQTRAMCGALLSHFPCCFLSQSLTDSGPVKLASLAWQGEGFSCFHPALGWNLCHFTVFCVCAREPNLGCHTYTSTLPTEPSSQSWFYFFLWMNNFFFLVIFYLSTGLSANMSITCLDCCMFKWTSEYR